MLAFLGPVGTVSLEFLRSNLAYKRLTVDF